MPKLRAFAKMGRETKFRITAATLLVVLIAIFLEVGSRTIFAIKLNDPDIFFYPVLEEKAQVFTYNQFSPTGSLQPQNSVDGYLKYRPDTQLKMYALDGEGELRPYTTMINNLGFRGRALDPKLSHNLTRIICLGESSTFGAYNRDETTWPAALERMLNATNNDDRYEVINMGVSESTTKTLSAIILNEVLPLRPDLVLFYGGNNDVAQYLFGRKNQIKLSRSYSFFFELIRAQYYRSIYHEAVSGSEYADRVFSGASVVGTKFSENLRRAAENLGDSGVNFAIVLQSLAAQGDLKGTFNTYSEYYQYLLSGKERAEFEFSLANNIAFIHYQMMSDLNPDLGIILDGRKALAGRQHEFVSHVHLTPEGNALLAKYLQERVQEILKSGRNDRTRHQ